MHEFTAEAITFYLVVFAIGTLSSLARSFSDADRGDALRYIGFALTSGFFALGICGYIVGGRADSSAAGDWNRWYYVALAALIGGLGKEQDNLRVWIIDRIKTTFGAGKKE